MANILTHPTNGAIYFDDGTPGSSSIPALTGNAVSLNHDGSAGLNIVSKNTTSTDRFTIDGDSGRLFSVNDSLTGTIFSVNDASGLPIVEVESTSSEDTVTIGTYNTNALVVKGNLVGIGTASPSGKLDIVGDGADFFLQSADYKIARIQPRGTSGANLDKGLFSLFDGSTEDVRIDTAGSSWFNGGSVSFGSDVAVSGNLTAPTAGSSENSTKVATTAFVKTEITNLVGGAPGALDTLNELAAAINDDASYASTVTTSLAGKAGLSSSNSFTNSYNEFGNNTGAVSNDGSWNARVNIAGTQHARLDLFEDADNSKLRMYVHTGQGARIGTTSNTALNFETYGTVRMTIPAGSATVSTVDQGTLWGSSNDGSGSGLDADLLDGQHGSHYLNASNISSGTVPVARMNQVLPTSGNYVWSQSTTAGNYTTGLQCAFVQSSDGWPSYGSVLHVGARGGGDAGGDFQIYCGHGSGSGGNYLRVRNADNNASPSDAWTDWRTIWDSGNDGSGSGLDADKLDGLHASSFNQVIGTDSDIDTSGATVIDQLNMTDGVIQSHSTRTLTLANLGYTGATNANNYSLPAGSSSTRGGFKIGYSESGKNYPVEVSSEKMYVNVPWTDTNTNTTYSAGTHLALSGTTFNLDLATTDKVLNIGHNATTNNEGEIIIDTSIAGSPQIGFTEHGDASWAIGVDDGDNSFKIHGNASTTIPTINNLTTPDFEIDTNGVGYLAGNRVFADNYHPNADALTTSRTIALGGDLSGSASFSGSSDITITAQIAANAVGTSEIATDAVGASEIAANAVGASEIAASAVGASELNVSGNGSTSQFLRSDGDGTFTWATPTDSTKLPLAGGTVTGDLTVNGKTILGNALSDKAVAHGHLGIGDDAYPKIAYPGQNALWSGSGSTTGQIVIDLPGTLNNYDMMYMEIDIYEYSSVGATKLIIGGHNWNSNGNNNTSTLQWYNVNVQVLGALDKPVYFGRRNDGSNERRCIAIGETNSAWSYATVQVHKVHGAEFYATGIDWVGDWNIAQTTSGSYFTKNPTTNFNSGTTLETNGTIIAATTSSSENSTKVATTAYVKNQGYLTTSGKAADSNLLDGLDLHTGRNNNANKVVRTDGNGYIQAGWINTTSGDRGTTTMDRIYASNDGYIRYYTPANFGAQIGSHISYNDLTNKPTIPSLSGYATESYVGTQISNLIGGAPGALDTLNELAAAINDDASYASTITTALAGKLSTTGKAADSDKLDGVNSSSFARSDAADTFTQRMRFDNCNTNNHDNIASATGSQGGLEVYNNGAGNDAFMAFHSGGDYAIYFGLDADSNKLSVGGWSMGANKYEIYHSGNKPSLATLGYTGATNANNYSLPAGSSSTRGGFKIGYSENGKNYPVEVSSEKMYVNVPWSDTNTNTTYSAGTGISLSGTTFSLTDTASKLSLSGGTMTGNTLVNNYGIGNVGLYSATKYQAVWSMGNSYLLPASGANTGSLYGLAWTHTNIGGQSKSGLSHQLLVCHNGTTKSAIGSGIWTDGTITTTGHGTSANWNTAYGWGNHASQGYTTNTGDITNVSVGTGLDGGGSSGSVTINLDLTEVTLGAGLDSTATGLSLDLSELTDMTGSVNTSQDELILLDNGAERRKRFSEIFGSNAYNSTTIPTNTNQLTNGANFIAHSSGEGVAIGASYQSSTPPSNGMIIQGNVGIGTSSVSGYYALQVNGNIQGSYKSFVIDHPTKENKQLAHACLEGPEIGVYFRGKSTSDTIVVADYWDSLVDIDTMTVDLTAIGPGQDLFVSSIKENGDVVVGTNTDEPLNYYYVVYGERKDINKLDVEFEIEENNDEEESIAESPVNADTDSLE